ncbi:hypothetical protein [Streptomyces sp. bgisy027]|uniref:hypothetical protein n=1 Tax=unclassified Streptomyces TaxID=2593676 RepID=UPI003D721D4A
MPVLGSVDFADALARIGRFPGYRVTVPDARRLPHSRLDSRTAVAGLTHDAELDVPVLGRAVRLPLGHAGAWAHDAHTTGGRPHSSTRGSPPRTSPDSTPRRAGRQRRLT